ncbi:MAG: sulfatase [Xanthobacteraceae bacterium]|nr:sulfatase [Xanthobacteraceae bacterium]
MNVGISLFNLLVVINFSARSGARTLARALTSPTARLLAAGVLLPNLLSLASLPFDISIPPRTAAILLFMAIAISARFVAYPFVVVYFLLALAFDLVATFALQFNLAPTEFLVAIKHATTLNLFSSPVYLALAVGIATLSAASLWLLNPRHLPDRAKPSVIFFSAILIAAIDFFGHVSPHYYFGKMIGTDKPVESASLKSGFGNAFGATRRNTIVVVVESMGQLVDADARAWIAAPFGTPDIKARYRVTSGSAEYFGSTTAGEIRELCGSREAYDGLDPARAAQCLPARLRRKGYTTMAFHAYSRKMFDRANWYPTIGFDRMLFGEDMLPGTKRTCGTVFRGGCDSDMEDLIARAAGGAKKPFLIYWLTLNTHVPVVPADAKVPLPCDDAASRNVCVMSSMWRQVFGTVARLALDPRIGPADVLVVGDHAPPLWSTRERGLFEPGRVAWYRLSPI